MEFRQLRYFLAVAEELHFTRASEKLHVAQPALSLQIRQLEEELGVQLFERVKHRVDLTPAGRTFAQHARLALEQAAKAAREASLVGRGEAGSISIGFVSSATISVMPDILRRFTGDLPSVNVELLELDPLEQIEALRNGTVDIGVMHALVDSADLKMTTLAREKLLAALPQTHAVAQCHEVDLSNLVNEKFLVPKKHQFGGLHETVVEACHRAGFIPKRIQSTRLLITALSLVGQGLGIALVPESFQAKVGIAGVVYRSLTCDVIVELVAVWLEENDSPLLKRFRTYFPNLDA